MTSTAAWRRPPRGRTGRSTAIAAGRCALRPAIEGHVARSRSRPRRDPVQIMTSVPVVLRTSDVVGLKVRRSAHLDPAAVCRALAAPAWLGQLLETTDIPSGARRHLTDLVLPLPPDGRVLSLRKATLVDLGPSTPLQDGGCEIEIAWRSATLAPLFPVFAGRLVVDRSGLTLEGRYAPPGGALGRAADRMLLHTAATGTARWFVGHVLEAVGA